MARINQLEPHLANLIAAGEVVERPGSVAKELIENALDAGASRITVELKNGGVRYLRVSDDGAGIFPQDVPTAFLRHATSKIQTEDDLSAIATMGFRGEALAAVAAVARVDMFTRTRHSAEGVQITLEGGQTLSLSETGCPLGTTVVVRDLFFNVPARAKFLKKDATEGAYVEAAVVQAALARPDVAFTLIKDGRESLFAPGDGTLLGAVHAVCGREIAARLISTAGSHGHITVDGYIAPPAAGRANRNMQYFFVNGRPVRARLLSAALDQAYKGRMMTGRHPACFLNLRLHVSAVDVNVHPAKLEVKFSSENEAFSAVCHAVQTALSGFDAGVATGAAAAQWPGPPPPAAPTPSAGAESVPPVPGRPTAYQQSIRVARGAEGMTFGESFAQSGRMASGGGIAYQTRPPQPPEAAPSEAAPPEGEAAPVSEAAPASEAAPSPAYLAPLLREPEPEPAAAPHRPSEEGADAAWEGGARLVGQAFKTYLLAEDAEGLWLIDKHAAHERMLHNELSARLGDMPAQLLLEPVTVTLSRREKAACLEHLDAFARAGFAIEDLGGGALIVRQIPAYLDEADTAFAISDMAGRLLSARPQGNGVLDALLSSMACRGAIKAGDQTGPEEMAAFAAKVMADPTVRHCPHGRPVLVRLSRREIEKLFGRLP